MTATHELTCKELVERVTDYLEGTMSPAERVAVDQHLVFCTGCEIYLAQMRETIRLAGTLREEDVDPEAADALLRVFRDWKASR